MVLCFILLWQPYKNRKSLVRLTKDFPFFKASLRIPPNNNILHVVCPVDIVCEGDAAGVSAVAGIRETVRARIHLHPRPTLLGNFNHLLVKYQLVLYFLTLPHWNHQIQLGHAIDLCTYKNKHVYIQDYRLLLLHFDTVIILI